MTPRFKRSASVLSVTGPEFKQGQPRHSYVVINSKLPLHSLHLEYEVDEITDLLRVIRRGPTVKSIVDDAIDQCSEVYNLRDSIEEAKPDCLLWKGYV